MGNITIRNYKNVFSWICPDCASSNLDVPDTTAVPLCGDCDTSFEWFEIEAKDTGKLFAKDG